MGGLAEIVICGDTGNESLFFEEPIANWVIGTIQNISPENQELLSWKSFRRSYEEELTSDFQSFISSESFDQWRRSGLLIV